MSVIRVPKTNCLRCGATLDAVGDLEQPDARGPQPGDPILCIRCGAVATIDAAGALRPFTEAEARELEGDATAMREMAKLAHMIYIVRHAQN